ncbi:MAG: hypothetical protein Q9215_003135 [Flavoplaca cf. flavocitrina]
MSLLRIKARSSSSVQEISTFRSHKLSEDSRNSLLALRRTSRAHKSFVDPVLYRSLELSDEEERFDAAEHKIQRLLDPNDDLYLHVRHLIVSNTKRAYTNYGKLQKVTTSQLEQYSKLPELREILLRSSNLQKLDIKFEYNWLDRKAVWTGITARPHVLNLPLQPSDRLPSLQELTFSGPPETYEFTREHCRLWKQCMDWSHLRRLDLGISCPQYFFEEIGSCLTNLRSLAMGVRIGDRYFTHWAQGPLTSNNINVVTNFITCIPMLQELSLTNFVSGESDLFQSIRTKCTSLRKLYYHASINRHDHLVKPYILYPVLVATISELLELRQLTFDFPLLDGHWPTHLANDIAKLARLDTLKIFIELRREATDFAAAYHVDPVDGGYDFPPLNLELAIEVATGLFMSFFAHSAYACLTKLEICFLRFQCEDRGQTFENQNSIQVTRLERDDAPSPLDGGYVVVGDGKWVEHDMRTQRVV